MKDKIIETFLEHRREPLAWFIAISLLMAMLSWGTMLSGHRGFKDVVFDGGKDFFADTFNIYIYLDAPNIYTGEASCTTGYYGHPLPRTYRNQTPLAYMYFDALRLMLTHHNAHLLLAVYISILFSIALLYLLFRKLCSSEFWKVLFCICILLSELFVVSIERGNHIWLSIIGVTIFVFHQRSRNKYIRELALLCLAFSGALKVYPALLGLLLVYQRQWKRCFRLTIYGVLLALLPFLYFPGGFALVPDLMLNVFSPHSQESPCYLLFSYLLPWLQTAIPDLQSAAVAHNLYNLGKIMGLACYALAFFQQTNWKRLLLLIFPLLLIPKVGGIYNFLYLLPCLVVFFNESKGTVLECTLAGLFAVIFSLLVFPEWLGGTSIRFLKAIALDLSFFALVASSLQDLCRKYKLSTKH